jgi:hypothetical protein
MIGASLGDSWTVIKWANGIWLLAAFASKNLAVCGRGFPTRAPFDWNVDNVVPAQLILIREE